MAFIYEITDKGEIGRVKDFRNTTFANFKHQATRTVKLKYAIWLVSTHQRERGYKKLLVFLKELECETVKIEF